MTAMMALSLRRPWPQAIFTLDKRVENRGWVTHFRGPIVLHAAKGFDQAALDYADSLGMFLSPFENQHPTGFVGWAQLVDICPGTRAEAGGCWEAEDDFIRGEIWTSKCGPWAQREQRHWKLDQPRRFSQPIPGPGRQGLFKVPDELVGKIREAARG